MPKKLPIANFKTQAEWHIYLDSLNYSQLKKISLALNKILRIDYKLDINELYWNGIIISTTKELYMYISIVVYHTCCID